MCLCLCVSTSEARCLKTRVEHVCTHGWGPVETYYQEKGHMLLKIVLKGKIFCPLTATDVFYQTGMITRSISTMYKLAWPHCLQHDYWSHQIRLNLSRAANSQPPSKPDSQPQPPIFISSNISLSHLKPHSASATTNTIPTVLCNEMRLFFGQSIYTNYNN